jgi:peptide/nickel transport system substrate-binding protein
LNLLAGSFGKLMNSPAAVEKHGEDYARNPVGTGPFMFDAWVPGERITLVKNPNYWREGPFIDVLELRPIPEGSARLLALEGGDVDAINQVPAQNLAMLEENPQIDVMYKTILRLFYWAFNHTKEPWTNPQIRVALNHAIDRQSIVDNILFGVGEVANSFVSPSVPGSIPIDVYDFNPEKARQMLEEAGYPFDYEATCYVTEGRYYQDRQVAEAIQGMLAEAGVKVNVEVLEWGAFVDAIWFTPADDPVAQARDFMQTSFGSDDPPTWMRQTLHKDMWPPTGFNEAFYPNPKVAELIDAINQTADPEKRRTLLGDIQRELINAPPWIISHFEQAVVAHKANVTGLVILPTGQVSFRLARVTA